MNSERTFQIAFWTLIGLMVLMRCWFAFRVRLAGERLMPDRAAIHREGWGAFAVRVAALLFFIALFAMIDLRCIRMRWFAFYLPAWLRWAAFAVGLASLGLWTWTHVELGRFWSAQLQLRAGHRLITTGPYARVRHPMYTAILVWATSLGLVLGNWIPLFLVAWAVAIFASRVRPEERMMLEQFGDEYRQYMKRTGKFLPRW
jgi:protein-S-isoprenylcysteine O-methyltransferase Ste14